MPAHSEATRIHFRQIKAEMVDAINRLASLRQQALAAGDAATAKQLLTARRGQSRALAEIASSELAFLMSARALDELAADLRRVTDGVTRAGASMANAQQAIDSAATMVALLRNLVTLLA